MSTMEKWRTAWTITASSILACVAFGAVAAPTTPGLVPATAAVDQSMKSQWLHDLDAMRTARHAAPGGGALRSAPAATAPNGGASANLVIANSYRAYPPSCLSDPLPGTPTGPTVVKNVVLAAVDTRYPGQFFQETVLVTLWRVACSTTVGRPFNSATLMTISRQGANNGQTTYYPLFPGVRVSQGNNSLKLVRVAVEPNTVISHVYPDTSIIQSQTYVLENFPTNDSTTAYFDFNVAFTLTMYNFFNGDQGQSISLSTYSPTQSTYPDAYSNLPLSGYMSGNWYDPAHSGEGINLEVGEVDNSNQRYLFFAWFTFDELGLPYWLSGSTLISPVDGTTTPTKTAVAQTIYRTGGGFAGNFGADTSKGNWGTVTFSFPSCNELTMSWQALPGLPANTPGRGANGGGSVGTRNWRRASTINGLTCE